MSERQHWKKKRKKHGKGYEYHISSLPGESQTALYRTHASQNEPELTGPLEDHEKSDEPEFHYDPEELWDWAAEQTQKKRDIAAWRAMKLREVMQIKKDGKTLKEAMEIVAAEYDDVSYGSLRNWYHGVNNRIGAKHFHPGDWDAALIDGNRGGGKRAEISEEAWEWFKGYYLTRKAPDLNNAYRRLKEVAKTEGWRVPSLATVRRKVKKDISVQALVYHREGERKLVELYPVQRRDKRCFKAGEAVNGDGLKFDKLWVKWDDGEILNTSTGWFWQDIYSGKILAHRLAKTENTDLFRLATYDLLGICLPRQLWLDNTRVAANNAMTAGAKYRNRNPGEAEFVGHLVNLGIDTRFTNPDKVFGNPGSKPIERAFGIGGLHEMVRTNPKLMGRGYSKATAIDYDLFAEVVADEVARFNAQPGRLSAVCGGTLSYNEAFDKSFSESVVRKATEKQRAILLLMPEAVRATRSNGEIHLKAGSRPGPNGKHRYWSEELLPYRGEDLVAYYDPANLKNPIIVQHKNGQYICKADNIADCGFNNTDDARTFNRERRRKVKGMKIAAEANERMNQQEVADLYPDIDDAAIPAPGIIQGNFKQDNKVTRSAFDKKDANTLEDANGNVVLFEDVFQDSVEKMERKQRYENGF